ncbi:oxamate carbamoyltransferase subunit AllH family protein [Streptomyces sp. NPDC001940]|uniref:oxamate carbamoyltransferase subunit AllH family protein n=1 Tax=unclassified Streptomyces TaxID=2593676 RepID=UPI0035DAD5C4
MTSLGTATGLRAMSGDAALIAHLRVLRGQGVVDSVFHRTVNVLTPGERLVALAARGGGDAPRTLVTDVDSWSGRGISAGQAVEFAPGVITLRAADALLRVHTEGADEWHPILPSLAALGPRDLAAAASALDRLIQAHGSRGGMLGPTPTASSMEAAVTRALADGRDTLVRAIRSADDAGMRRGVLSLLGLGPGLTPAGDDFLTALALLSSLQGSGLAPFGRALQGVLLEHPGRTTRLSVTTLDEALAGRARAALLDVLHALAHPSGWSEARPTESIRTPVRHVLAIGHTSGTDTLSGLVTGLRLEKELRGSL